MDLEDILRRLRGALGNAMVWGAGWFAATVVVGGILSVLGVISGSVLDILMVAVRASIVGGVAGAAFSSMVSFLYSGRRLSDINWVRFGLGGGLLAAAFIPLFLQTMNLLSGQGLVAWDLVLDDAVLGLFFGSAVAGGSMKLAQSVDLLPSGERPELETEDGMAALAPAEEEPLG